MEMSLYLGIDVSKETLDVCLLREQGSDDAQMSNNRKGFNQLHHWLQKRKASGVHVCLEATGIYGLEVAQFLHEKGYRVSVVNPTRIKGFAQSQMRRSKTDKLDAAVIAAFCRALQPDLWTPPEPAWYALRALVRHIDDLQHTRQQQVNRLESAALPAVREQLQQHIAFIDAQIAQIKNQIKAHLKQFPHLKRQVDLLKSIPGIADLSAWRLLAEIGIIARFADIRQVVAFVGLDPTRHESGRSVRGGRHISRKGRASLRSALFMPALTAQRYNPVLQAFAQRLKANGKLPKQIVVAVMRKLLHLAYGILKSGQPFVPDYGHHFHPSIS
jgi:transposase